MKPFLSLFLVLLCCISSSAKKGKTPVTDMMVMDTIVIGKHYNAGGTPVFARQFKFDYKVLDAGADSNNNLCLFLRREQRDEQFEYNYAASLNVNSGALTWEKQITPFTTRQAHFTTQQTRDVLLGCYTNPGQSRTTGFNKYTGETIFKNIHTGFISTDWNRNFGLTSYCHLVDLTSNKVLWKRNIENGEQQAKSVVWLGDTAIAVMLNGLHTLNINTGKGWSYHSKTSIDYSGANDIAAVGALLVSGFVGYAILSATWKPAFISGLASNILIDSSGNYYFSTQDGVAKFSSSGTQLWLTPSVKKELTSAFIYDAGDRVLFINTGLVYENEKPVQRGKAFIAAYNKNDGKELFKLYPDNSKTLEVQQVVKDTLITKMGNRLISYSTLTGKVIAYQPEPKIENTSIAVPLEGSLTYIKEANGGFQRLDNLYPEALYFKTDSKLEVLNAHLKKVMSCDERDVWHREYNDDGNMLLSQGNYWLKLYNGIPVANFQGIGSGKIVGKNLVFTEGEKLMLIDWTQL